MSALDDLRTESVTRKAELDPDDCEAAARLIGRHTDDPWPILQALGIAAYEATPGRDPITRQHPKGKEKRTP